jgi:hypothetical protein
VEVQQKTGAPENELLIYAVTVLVCDRLDIEIPGPRIGTWGTQTVSIGIPQAGEQNKAYRPYILNETMLNSRNCR